MSNCILTISRRKELANRFTALLENYAHIYQTNNIHDAMWQMTKFKYDLLIIVEEHDIENVCEIIQTIRKLKKLPILIISSKCSEEKVLYLLVGADVVMSDVCSALEIKHQSLALIRRYVDWSNDINKKYYLIQSGALYMNYHTRKACWDNKEIRFTYLEFDFLFLLASTPGRVYQFEQIYQSVWKESPHGDINNIVWCIKYRIGKKLKKLDLNSLNIIKNIRNIGYYYDPD